MDNERKKKVDRIRYTRFHRDDSDESFEKRLAAANTTRINAKFYDEGYIWFSSGKELDEAVDNVDYFGKLMAVKDILSFQRGYQAGLINMGREYGYNEVNLTEIDVKYSENKYFLSGYKKGLESREKEKSRGFKK